MGSSEQGEFLARRILVGRINNAEASRFTNDDIFGFSMYIRPWGPKSDGLLRSSPPWEGRYSMQLELPLNTPFGKANAIFGFYLQENLGALKAAGISLLSRHWKL